MVRFTEELLNRLPPTCGFLWIQADDEAFGWKEEEVGKPKKRKFGWPVASVRVPTSTERQLLCVESQQEYKCFVRFQGAIIQ